MKKVTVLDRMAGNGVMMDYRNALAESESNDAQMRHDELLANMKRKKKKKQQKMAMMEAKKAEEDLNS